jgi:long-chain acyl-CoA synthetase
MDYIAALIVLSINEIRTYCRSHGISADNIVEVVDHAQIQALLKKEIETVNKSLPDFEKIKRYKILTSPWTQETGELTPTLKIKRKFIRDKYAHEIEFLKRKSG